jgi:hypothetical protein
MGDLPGGVFLYDIQCLIPDGHPIGHRVIPVSLRSTPKSYLDGTKAVVDPEEVREPELRALAERLGNAMARAQQDTAVEKPTAQIIQFPLFPEEKRPVSNDGDVLIQLMS